jgi:NAD(P)H-dependent flavin oxidoreductase YrpB (nitropropane dioxygenase family)
MAAALALGARGVWCVSVWLTTVESECSPLMRQKLIDAGTDDTVKTKTFTGKPARYLRSAWVDEWGRPDAPELLPNPLHTVAIGKYLERIDRAAATGRYGPEDGPGRLVSKPVGQIVGSLNRQTSSRQVVLDMMEECVEALDRVQQILELE